MIGLFGFVGMVGVAMAIPVGRLIDRLVPWYAAVVSITLYIVVTAIGVGADGLNIACVVIVCIGVDVLRQTIQITMTTWVFELDLKARSRINAIVLVAESVFARIFSVCNEPTSLVVVCRPSDGHSCRLVAIHEVRLASFGRSVSSMGRFHALRYLPERSEHTSISLAWIRGGHSAQEE